MLRSFLLPINIHSFIPYFLFNLKLLLKLSCQFGISTFKMFLILDLSKTLKIGRFAGVGYAFVLIGFVFIVLFDKSKITFAKSYQLATP